MFSFAHRKNIRASLWLLLVLLLLTVAISWFIQRQSLRYSALAFDAQINELEHSLGLCLRDNEELLLGAKGLYQASQTVEREEFHNYINSLDVAHRYPGMQSLGYSKWIAQNEVAALTQNIRDQGVPQFSIFPQGERQYYSTIIYVESFSQDNTPSVGFDLFSEPVHRDAITAAVEIGQARLSGKVKLVQAQQQAKYADSFLYLPIFKKGVPTNTAAQRWEALEGFVYAAFNTRDLLAELLPQRNLQIEFSLYAGRAADKSRSLFESPQINENLFTPAHHKYVQLELYGQPWLLYAESNAEFEQQHTSHLPVITLLVGIFIDCLLCAIFYGLVTQRQRALLLAKSMTEDARVINAQLKHSQDRFELALESSGMGIWSLRFSDNNMQWDASMCALFGLTDNNSLTTYESFLALVHREDTQRVFMEIAQAIEGKKGYDTEYRILWPDHQIRHLASRAKIIYEGGEAVSMIGTCWDISERKRLDKVKTEFVSTVSHELRTPLTAITGALGLMIGGNLFELPEKAKNVLDIAYKNAQRLKLLINDLLDMDKLLAGKLEFHCEPQPLMPLVERAVIENRAYADQMQVRYQIVPASVAPRVDVEDIRVLQIMANFLSNAAKFSKPDSDVIISLTCVEGYARISVSDTGVGLDEESKSHIFEKFYQVDSSDTRNKGGTGLGLAITKEIVERMNGRVGFTSVLGEGSTFYAEFPIVH